MNKNCAKCVYHIGGACSKFKCEMTTLEEYRNKVIDVVLEKATQIVYEANDRERNPQPRDMVADIHFKFLDLAEQMKGV